MERATRRQLICRQHTSFDLALAKSFGEHLTLRLTGLNLSNNYYMLDNSNTFAERTLQTRAKSPRN